MKMPFKTGFYIASPFGYRVDPITGAENSWHGGVDLVGNDRNVRAAVGGTVLRSRIVEDPADRTSEWGNYVSVIGADGRICYYCHLAQRAVEAGARVEEGQVLGIEGTTGRSTGIHLHFEVRDQLGVQLDPCAYLGIPNRAGYEWDPDTERDDPEPVPEPEPEPEPESEPWESQCHEWSREAVEWAISRGILKGDGNGNYRLGDAITREEAVVLLYRAREVL